MTTEQQLKIALQTLLTTHGSHECDEVVRLIVALLPPSWRPPHAVHAPIQPYPSHAIKDVCVHDALAPNSTVRFNTTINIFWCNKCIRGRREFA